MYAGQPTRVCITYNIITRNSVDVQSVPKKMVFSGKMAISTFKLIQIANVGGVLENSGNLLHYGYRDFKN